MPIDQKSNGFQNELIVFRWTGIRLFPSRVNSDTQQRQGEWNIQSSIEASSTFDWLYSSNHICQAQISSTHRSISGDRSLSHRWRSSGEQHSISSSRTIHRRSCQWSFSFSSFSSFEIVYSRCRRSRRVKITMWSVVRLKRSVLIISNISNRICTYRCLCIFCYLSIVEIMPENVCSTFE